MPRFSLVVLTVQSVDACIQCECSCIETLSLFKVIVWQHFTNDKNPLGNKDG